MRWAPKQVRAGVATVAAAVLLAACGSSSKTGSSPSSTISGAGCSAKAQERRIASWSVEGIPLHAQTATGQTLPHFGGPGQPDGLIGSDVWSAFGATRIDFRHGEIVVPGPEGAFPKRETLVKKPVTSPLPGALLHGRPRIVAPMSLDASPTQTLVFVGIAFGSRPKSDFTPDTGASSSAVDTSVAKAARMTPTGIQARNNTACSIITLPKVASGPWSLAGHPLVPQPLVTARLLTSGPAAGLLGADQMNRYGSVIFDYRGGRLVLGAG